MNKQEIQYIKTDVAVIGGGTAGLHTAMAAAEKGCDVLVVDKANINRSGAIAGGIDHFMAYMENGEDWDTRESYLRYVGRVARGAANLKIHEKVYCDELTDAIKRVERIGVSLRHPQTGEFYRTQSMGQPGPFWINFNGKRLKPKMAKEVRRLGCRVLNRVQVTNLFLNQGQLAGLTGFDIRTGTFYAIQAKALVISTGNTNRMFKSQTGNPFNLWYCPACTGDLHRAAFDAGVELANMEYVRMTIVPKGLSAPGFNAFFGMGSHLVNSMGERFMEKVHPMGEMAPRNYMIWGALQELKEGRGPIYMDCRHLDEKDRAHLFETLGYDKDTLPDFFIKKGYNFKGTMIEMTVSEPMQARPSELCGSGIKIDETCASNVPGIFAAGDASDQMGCLHMCTTGGYAAGKQAAKYAGRQKVFNPLDKKAVSAEQGRIFAPGERKTGIAYWELEQVIRSITTDHFGPVKTEKSLTGALTKLNNLDKYRQELKAGNLHELMRVHEALNIHKVAKITATAALERKESRFPPYHYRADYTETNDEKYCGLVVVRKDSNGEISTRLEPLTYPD
jgi:adenylylsulfate reductase, subunit A